ncbi:MAG: hypothetical protein ACM3S2_12290 [Ignavibacteriales bacterium]
MKMNNKVLMYLAGSLTEADRKVFELELEQDPRLRSQLEEARGMLVKLREYGNPEADTHYFTNLLPAVRARISGKKKFSLYPKLAYVLPVLAVIAFFIFKPFSSKNADAVDINRTVTEMNDQAKSDILNSMLVSESGSIRTDMLPENSGEVIESRVANELYKTEEIKSQYIDTDELINNLSSDEAEEIYNNMIHKKIL